MKLRTKIIVILVVTVIIVMSGSGLFFFVHYKSAFRDSVYQAIDSAAVHEADILSRYLNYQLSAAMHIGETVPYLTIEYEDYDWLTDYFRRHLKNFAFFNEGFSLLMPTGFSEPTTLLMLKGMAAIFPATSFSVRPWNKKKG